MNCTYKRSTTSVGILLVSIYRLTKDHSLLRKPGAYREKKVGYQTSHVRRLPSVQFGDRRVDKRPASGMSSAARCPELCVPETQDIERRDQSPNLLIVHPKVLAHGVYARHSDRTPTC